MVVLAALLLLLAFSLYVQWDSGQVVSSANAQTYEMYKPEDSEHLTFDQLVERNPDVFGWLTIDGTKVDYPVAQGQDNAKYVNTSPLGEFSISGAIFLDYRNDRAMTDVLSILYGHHMEDDEMFGGFDSFADGSYFDGHRTGNLYFGGKNHGLQVFAVLEADGYDTQVYDPNLQEANKDAYLDLLRERSLVYRDDFNRSLPILMLSTCESGETNGRILLAATVGPPEDLVAQSADSTGDLWWSVVIIVVLALALLLLLIWFARRRRKERDAVEDAAVAESQQRMSRGSGGMDQVGTERRMSGEKSGSAVAQASGARAGAHMRREAPEPADKGENRDSSQPPLLSDLLALLGKLAGIAAVLVAIFTLVFGIHIASGTGMASAVHDRDVVVYYRLDTAPDVRDLLVYTTPEGEERVGRVVASAGDSVDVTSEGLKVNGYAQQEEYVKGETLAFVDGVDYPVALSTGQYFVLDDNRDQGEDSRLFGPVSSDQIKGRVITVIRRRDF